MTSSEYSDPDESTDFTRSLISTQSSDSTDSNHSIKSTNSSQTLLKSQLYRRISDDCQWRQDPFKYIAPYENEEDIKETETKRKLSGLKLELLMYGYIRRIENTVSIEWSSSDKRMVVSSA